MLNISNQRVADDLWQRSARLSRPALLRAYASRRLSRVLLVLGGAFLLVLFLPWRQTIYGSGSVTSLTPQGRPQTIQNQIAGRIEHWDIREASARHPRTPCGRSWGTSGRSRARAAAANRHRLARHARRTASRARGRVARQRAPTWHRHGAGVRTGAGLARVESRPCVDPASCAGARARREPISVLSWGARRSIARRRTSTDVRRPPRLAHTFYGGRGARPDAPL